MKYILFIVLFMLTFEAFSQDRFSFDWNGQDFIDTLKHDGVDTIFIVKSYCVGVVMIDDDSKCQSYSVNFDLYVFWKKEGSHFYKKFNNCFEYETVKLDSIHFLKYYYENHNVIITEKIEPSIGFEIENGDTLFIFYDVDHYCKMDIFVEIHQEKYQNECYDYFFDATFSKYTGMRNKNLKLFNLYRFIQEELVFLEKNYPLKIEK